MTSVISLMSTTTTTTNVINNNNNSNGNNNRPSTVKITTITTLLVVMQWCRSRLFTTCYTLEYFSFKRKNKQKKPKKTDCIIFDVIFTLQHFLQQDFCTAL